MYDGQRLAREIASAAGVVVEGFCLFCYPDILALRAQSFYVDVPFSVTVERRSRRRPKRLSDRSYSLIGEQENAAFILPQRSLPGIRVLNGMLPIPDLRMKCFREDNWAAISGLRIFFLW